MSYEPYYSGGWQSGESGGTPITPEALNHMEEGIEKAALNDDLKAAVAERNIQSYTALKQIGLTVDDFSDDALSNFILIFEKLPVRSELWITSASTATLAESIYAKMMEDTGLAASSYYDIQFRKTGAVLMEIDITMQYYGEATVYPAYRYSCVLRYTSGSIEYLSPFALTRAPGGFNGPHNKPTGRYTGSGEAGTQTIEIGGSGNVLAIWSTYGMAIVTPGGVLCKKQTTVSALLAVDCNFRDGYLTISSDDTVVNAADTRYNYQVL